MYSDFEVERWYLGLPFAQDDRGGGNKVLELSRFGDERANTPAHLARFLSYPGGFASGLSMRGFDSPEPGLERKRCSG